jgi:hypothetical protein
MVESWSTVTATGQGRKIKQMADERGTQHIFIAVLSEFQYIFHCVLGRHRVSSTVPAAYDRTLE